MHSTSGLVLTTSWISQPSASAYYQLIISLLVKRGGMLGNWFTHSSIPPQPQFNTHQGTPKGKVTALHLQFLKLSQAILSY